MRVLLFSGFSALGHKTIQSALSNIHTEEFVDSYIRIISGRISPTRLCLSFTPEYTEMIQVLWFPCQKQREGRMANSSNPKSLSKHTWSSKVTTLVTTWNHMLK